MPTTSPLMKSILLMKNGYLENSPEKPRDRFVQNPAFQLLGAEWSAAKRRGKQSSETPCSTKILLGMWKNSNPQSSKSRKFSNRWISDFNFLILSSRRDQ